MKREVTRREFLRVAIWSAAASAGLAGWAPALRWDDEIAFPLSQDGVFATTCGVCPAGCGMLVQVQGGRAVSVEGNPAHPLNQGDLCSRAQRNLEILYHPGRLKGPLRRVERGVDRFESFDWDAAIAVVRDAWRKYAPGEIAFLTGLFPDHTHDLIQTIARALGGASVQRLAAPAEMEGQVTLRDAAQKLFGIPCLPGVDLANAQVVFAFGVDLRETWLVADAWRLPDERWVWFTPRRPATGWRGEWVAVRPGSQAILAQGLSQQVARLLDLPSSHVSTQLDQDAISRATGVPQDTLERLAKRFASASRRVAVPGRLALGSSDGLAAAQAILALNVLVDNLGQPGGLFLSPDAPLHPQFNRRPSTAAEMQVLIERMKSGQVKALFVHGVDPVAALPRSIGFAQALPQVECLVSFASILDQTARLADYVLPDDTLLEMWGYQKPASSVGGMAVSALRPVVTPQFAARSTGDVLLQAAQGIPGVTLPYAGQEDFLRQSLAALEDQGGSWTADSWQLWAQRGGWWRAQAERISLPRLSPLELTTASSPAALPEQDVLPSERAFYLLLVRETAPEMIAEMHPQAVRELGLQAGDMVRLSSAAGSVDARLIESGTLHIDCIAVSWPQDLPTDVLLEKMTVSNPLDLLGLVLNESGDLACTAGQVRVEAATSRHGG